MKNRFIVERLTREGEWPVKYYSTPLDKDQAMILAKEESIYQRGVPVNVWKEYCTVEIPGHRHVL